MAEPGLWGLSISAFSAVLVLLALLAGAVRLLTAVFRPPPPPSDAAVVAAIHATVQRMLPGGRVTRIEETR
jgi:hypothetical protein